MFYEATIISLQTTATIRRYEVQVVRTHELFRRSGAHRDRRALGATDHSRRHVRGKTVRSVRAQPRHLEERIDRAAQHAGRAGADGKTAGDGNEAPRVRPDTSGRDLEPVLLAITDWGDKYRPNPAGARLIFQDRETGVPIQPIHAVTEDGRPLKPGDVTAVLGPGGDPPLMPSATDG